MGGANLTDEAGVLLSSRLNNKSGNMVLALLGDSTGNDAIDWFRLAVNQLGVPNPDLRVRYTLWDHATQAYGVWNTPQAGTATESGGIVASDTFGRSGELVGSGSPAWAGTAGRWSTNGANAVCGGTGTMTLTSGVQHVHVTARFLDVTLDSTAAATTKEHRFYSKYLSTTTHLFVSVNVPVSGNRTAQLWKRINGTATAISAAANLSLATNQVNTFDVVIESNGDDVTATVNGVALSGTLAAGDAAALLGGTAIGFAAQSAEAALSSFTVGAVQVETPVVSTGQTLTVYNASHPGSTLAYQAARLATMLPVAPDAVILSSSHNYWAGAASDYIGVVEAMVDQIRALYPNALIVASSQNPQYTGSMTTADTIRGQLARLTELRIAAARNGWGYVPVVEAFIAENDRALVQADGVHPTVSPTGGPNGATFWRDVFLDWLARHAV